VELAVSGPVDPATGWLIDYAAIEATWRPLHEQLDHNYLNDVPGLENPTSENLARWIWERLTPSLPGLSRVTILETCDSRCEYDGD
jgi:6-pyruvoyltetrahydropterin/6-carboxytetrahydropterin synthase